MIMVQNRPNHILVVDDDEIDVMFVERELLKLKLKAPLLFHIAHDGLEALHKLHEMKVEKPAIKPRMIILDLMMPKMNGIEFLKVFRAEALYKSINIFVLTTSNNDKDKKATLAYNINGYFVKDSQFNDFILQCKNVLK